MKRVLITGAKSYVGTNVEKWLMKEPDRYYVETLDMKDPNWKNFDFSKFDVVFHVAGIAHIKETKKNRELYYKINRDLAVEVAQIAKSSGVKHFIFMSSMSVFGKRKGKITENTSLKPRTYYGKSKLEAESKLEKLNNHAFILTILRPPLIYGIDAPGNFNIMVKFMEKISFFPKVNNYRSMLNISNLCIHVQQVINNSISGVLHIQDFDYINTTKVFTNIKKIQNKRYFVVPFIGILIKPFTTLSEKTNKIFNSLYYDKEISGGPNDIHYTSYCMSYPDSKLFESLSKMIKDGK